MSEEIIDGVNVAECKDYRRVEYKEMSICMNYYNHLPKPLKGTEWQYCAGNKNCYYKQLKRLQAENERLKEINLQLQTIDMEIDTNNKYRKVLEEIREYIQSLNKDICNNCGWHNTDGCRPNSYVCHDLIEIQNKISEVLK